MGKKVLKEKSDFLALLKSLPEKDNPFLEIIRLLTEESDDIVYIHDGKLNFSYLSPGIFNVTGYSPEEWKHNPLAMLTPNPLNKAAAGFTQKALQTGQKIPSHQIEIYHKEGHAVLLEINETPFTQGGKLAGVIGIGRDISEKKKILRFVENFQSFLKANPIHLVIYNLEGLVSYLNPAFEKTFGWNSAELEGRKIPFFRKRNSYPPWSILKRSYPVKKSPTSKPNG